MIRFLFSFIILILFNTAFSQRPHFTLHELPVELSSAIITNVEQDNKGIIWLGSSKGLISFDGIEYSLTLNPDSNCSNVVSSITKGDKYLWIGYDDGCVGRLEDNLIVPVDLPVKPEVPVSGVLQLAGSDLLITTYGKGIFLMQNGSVVHMNSKNGLSDNYIYSVHRNIDNKIWLGTDRGINILDADSKTVDLLNTSDSLSDEIVQVITSDNNNKIWVGMHDKGIAYFDDSSKKFVVPDLLNNWKYGAVSGILPIDQEIWIATKRNGIIALVNQYDNYVRVYNKEYGLTQHLVSDLLIDKESNIWIATGNNFIQSVNKQFEFIYEHEEFDFGGMHAIMADKKGNLWFSNREGLFSHKIVFTGFNRLEKWIDIESLNSQQILCLYESSEGQIWIGTFGSGVYRLDPATGAYQKFDEKDGLVNNNVFSIDGDENGIWFGTLGGVSLLEKESSGDKPAFSNYHREDGLANDFIYKVFVDFQGKIWFGTDGNGISVYENGSFTNYSEEIQSGNLVILSITEDMSGNIWFSSSSDGIFRFDGNHFINYNMEDGLFNLDISAIKVDKNNELLIVHRSGLDILNTINGKFKYFDENAGINTTGQELNAISKDINGDIWISTRSSLIKYMAESKGNWQQPLLNITDVSIFFEEIEGNKHTFSHDENHITFKYVGLWYQNPEKVQYQYKLDGYDLDWIKTKDRSVTFPKLPDGSYRFDLRASISGNFEDTLIVSYPFTILKPFWKTGWFLLLVLILTGGLIYYFIRHRENRLSYEANLRRTEAVHQFETLKSQVNPHFLFNSFNTLALIIEEDQEMAIEYVEKLSDFFRSILQYQERETISLREELDLLNEYFYLQKKRYGDNLELETDIPESNLKSRISPLTLQLLVENAIKHNTISKSKPLKIIISSQDFYIFTENPVQLKNHSMRSTKTGLVNISNRYKLLTKNPVIVESVSNIFRVGIPLLKSNNNIDENTDH